MDQGVTTAPVVELMMKFASMTGLPPASNVPRRYLWTDAFAVCNFLGLHKETREARYKALAIALVDQVHEVLGRHRRDDPRTGWISGLGEHEGRLHPTRGGLRIGKQLPERKPGEPLDERLEWDRDGQYYHYLTKWMHTLNLVTRVTGDFTYNRWALELAKSVHARFVYTASPGGQKRMYWKMSTDLEYPLVPSMGLHDPLDGLITYTQLQATAAKDPKGGAQDLSGEIVDMARMCRGKNWATDDPLGIGGLLADAFRVAQLMVEGYPGGTNLLVVLLEASLTGLTAFDREGSLKFPADVRLAFRELGLSIGLKAARRLSEFIRRNERALGGEGGPKLQTQALKEYDALAEAIDRFWLEPKQQRCRSWKEHQEINMVMLATSLAPDGYLTL